MSGLSRRDFFQRFGHNLTDQVDLEKIQKLMPWSKEKAPKPEDVWVAVGTLSAMAPGTKCLVTIESKKLSLEADAEGVWLSQADGQRVAIRLDQGGVIVANSEYPRQSRWIGELDSLKGSCLGYRLSS